MTRRALFAMLAAAALDPERLLWVPGRKMISIPVPRAAFPQVFVLLTADEALTPSLFSEALQALHHRLGQPWGLRIVQLMTRAEFAARYPRVTVRRMPEIVLDVPFKGAPVSHTCWIQA